MAFVPYLFKRARGLCCARSLEPPHNTLAVMIDLVATATKRIDARANKPNPVVVVVIVVCFA